MTFATTTLAALSIAAIAAVASIEPVAVGTPTDTASTAAKSEHLILAQRRGKCTEDLGYGRTGSYGCG